LNDYLNSSVHELVFKCCTGYEWIIPDLYLSGIFASVVEIEVVAIVVVVEVGVDSGGAAIEGGGVWGVGWLGGWTGLIVVYASA